MFEFITRYLNKKGKNLITNGILLLFIIFIVKPFISAIYVYCAVKIKERTAAVLKETLLLHIQNIPHVRLSKFHTGDFLTILSSTVDNVSQIIPDTIISFLQGTITVVLALVYTFYLNWRMTLITLILTLLVIIRSKIMMPICKRLLIKDKKSKTNYEFFSKNN